MINGNPPIDNLPVSNSSIDNSPVDKPPIDKPPVDKFLVNSSSANNTAIEEKRDYHAFSVAPMLDWTDRHCRYFYRLLTQKALLYSEMITTGAILHGDKERHLTFTEAGPVALQLGGSDPADLALAAKIGEDFGYHEINLNCGCPSSRVQQGRFGACLMQEPDHVARCYEAMTKAVSIPVTIKTRIGVDHEDSYTFLEKFITRLKNVGCQTFIIHARKAWLQGLSPKENREIPPLNYNRVYDLKAQYPELTIVINGGVQTLDEVNHHLNFVDGAMIGRSVYHNPYLLHQVDHLVFKKDNPFLTRYEVLERMKPYIEDHLHRGGKLSHIARHMLGLFYGRPKSRLWRRYLSEEMHKEGANFATLMKAYEKMSSQ